MTTRDSQKLKQVPHPTGDRVLKGALRAGGKTFLFGTALNCVADLFNAYLLHDPLLVQRGAILVAIATYCAAGIGAIRAWRTVPPANEADQETTSPALASFKDKPDSKSEIPKNSETAESNGNTSDHG